MITAAFCHCLLNYKNRLESMTADNDDNINIKDNIRPFMSFSIVPMHVHPLLLPLLQKTHPADAYTLGVAH